jgi:hypothetical protein
VALIVTTCGKNQQQTKSAAPEQYDAYKSLIISILRYFQNSKYFEPKLIGAISSIYSVV